VKKYASGNVEQMHIIQIN